MVVAVDFDGTIVEHRYPSIGREIPFAIDTLKKLSSERHKLILWSVREGKLLDEAVAFVVSVALSFMPSIVIIQRRRRIRTIISLVS